MLARPRAAIAESFPMQESKQQVDQALHRLESALEAVAKREVEVQRGLSVARQELAEVRQENAALKALLAEAVERLDKTIDRIQALASAKGQ